MKTLFLLLILINLNTLIAANIIKNCDNPTKNLISQNTSSTKDCLKLCNNNPKCVSATFISGWNKCFLKSENKKILKIRIYSGIIDHAKENKIVEEGYDIDYPVGDFKKITDLKDPSGCKDACINDRRCKAFAFIETYNSCWLKDRHNKKQSKIFYCIEK